MADDGKKRIGIKREIDTVEKQLMQPARKYEPVLAEIRKNSDRSKLVHDLFHHYIACTLIRYYAVAPRRVMTWDKMDETCYILAEWEKQQRRG